MSIITRFAACFKKLLILVALAVCFAGAPVLAQTTPAQSDEVATGSTNEIAITPSARDAQIEDLRGKRLRAGGAGFVRFAEHFNAQGVRLPVNEVYEALDQGILDCAMLSAPELTNYNLYEVVTDITLDVPGGAFAGVASANINADRWKALSTEDREALLWGGSHMTASYG